MNLWAHAADILIIPAANCIYAPENHSPFDHQSLGGEHGQTATLHPPECFTPRRMRPSRPPHPRARCSRENASKMHSLASRKPMIDSGGILQATEIVSSTRLPFSPLPKSNERFGRHCRHRCGRRLRRHHLSHHGLLAPREDGVSSHRSRASRLAAGLGHAAVHSPHPRDAAHAETARYNGRGA